MVGYGPQKFQKTNISCLSAGAIVFSSSYVNPNPSYTIQDEYNYNVKQCQIHQRIIVFIKRNTVADIS